MKNMKALMILVLPIIAVVAISGCLGGTVVGTGNGIVIEEFKPTLTTVYSDQEVGLLLKIENQGEAEAQDIRALIFGINSDEWNADEEKNLYDLLGVDPVTSVAGGTKIVQWTQMRAPYLAPSLEHIYTPKVRVSYDYATSAIKPITIVDKDEMVRLIQEGEIIPTGVTTYTAGPLSVDVTTGTYAIGDTYTDYTFNLQVYVTNLWWGSNGRVESENSPYGDSDDLYPLEMMITLPDELSFESSWDQPGCSYSYDDISMWDGHTAEITCALRVDDAPEVMTEGLIQVDLRYRFSVDAFTTIEVTGTEY